MKRVFAQTQNVKSFVAAMGRLQGRQEGIPGLALVYSEPGLGKSRTCTWWIVHNGGICISAKAAYTTRWMLRDIVSELGEEPGSTIEVLFQQASGLLVERRTPIFVDEADSIIHNAKIIGTLKNLHDMTGTAIILLGEDMADKKLARYKSFYDRMSEILKFKPLSLADVKAITEQLCDVKLSDDAVESIHKDGNRFRGVVKHLYKAEALAKTNSYKEITADLLGAGRR